MKKRFKRVIALIGDTHIGCLPPQERVNTPNGIKRIAEKISKVLTYEGEEQVKHFFKREHKGEIIKIKAEGLLPIYLTPNHPVLSSKCLGIGSHQTWKKPTENHLEWIEAGKLNKNDWIVIPRLKDIKEEKVGNMIIDKDLSFILGFMIGDGCIDKGQLRIYFKSSEEYIALNIIDYLFKLKETTFIRLSKVKNMKMITLSFSNENIREWMEKIGKREERIIPKEIFNLHPNLIKYFLKGLFQADGSYLGDKYQGRMVLSSASIHIILGTQLLLAKLGIESCVHYRKAREHYDKKYKKIYYEREGYSLEVYSPELSQFIFNKSYIGNRKNHKQVITKNYIFHRIKLVEKEKYNGLVYNIETLSNTFLVKNVVVHNSRYAVYPSNHYTAEGNLIHINKVQKKLLEYWEDFVRVCKRENVDTVIHLGDVVEGTNRKSFGEGLVVPELHYQVEGAVKLLRPLVKGRKFFIVSGSSYHSSQDFKIHKKVAEDLGGKFLGVIANLEIEGTNRIFNIAHGNSGAMVYRTTIMDREGLFMLMAKAMGKLPEISLIARGHLHHFIHLHLRGQHLVQIPCWKVYQPVSIYMKNYGKNIPDIGGVIVKIDEEDRIIVWHYLYPDLKIDDVVKRI